MTYIRPNACKNMNHGRSNVSIGYCPECGQRFSGRSTSSCGLQRHMDFRKQRFIFCIDCGLKLAKA